MITMNKQEKVQAITRQIDVLQSSLKRTGNPIFASVLAKKYNELQTLGFDYNPWNQELIFIF